LPAASISFILRIYVTRIIYILSSWQAVGMMNIFSTSNLSALLFVIVFLIAHWYLSLFSQTFFQHRYAAHRSFTMTKSWEKIFFIFSYITQGSSYMSARAYGIMHRMHHAYTDTENDPHSPSYDENIMTMMWRTRNIYSAILNGRMEIEDRFTKNVPEWKWFDRWGNNFISRFLWIGVYVWLSLAFAPSAWWRDHQLVCA
jgi:stearoyl-CoA desaturase (Delta-9 desaturase)